MHMLLTLRYDTLATGRLWSDQRAIAILSSQTQKFISRKFEALSTDKVAKKKKKKGKKKKQGIN